MSNEALHQYTEIGRRLVNKWDSLLEGIDNPTARVNTAILLENESQRGSVHVMNEDTQSGQTGGGPDWGATTGAGDDIAPFQHYLLPLVRRVYPNLIANELVGVQPMTSPASLVFYLKYRYTGLVEQIANVSDNTSSPETTGTGRLSDSAVANGQTAAGTEYGNFIGNTWNIDPYYTLQKIYRENPTSTPNAVTPTAATGAFTAYTLKAVPKIDTVDVTVQWTFTDGTDTVVVSRGENDSTPTLQSSTKSTVTAVGGGALTVTSTTVAGAAVTFTDSASPDFVPTSVTVGITYEYDMEGNRQLPEIELEVASSAVTAQTRKLRTKWTIEASQDLRAMHNIDAEQELVSLLANEVTAEIDREILNDLITEAGIRVDYNYANPFIVGGQNLSAAAIPGVTSFDDRNKSLLYQILEVSNQIYRQSLRGAGNWVVTSPELAAKLESLLEFKPDARTDNQYNLGITSTGTVNGQFRVYKDPLFPPNLILVGYKGSSFMDAGMFYCPYVPLQLTPTVLDPESFNPRKGLITRYGKVIVENGARMYGLIRVTNMTAIGANRLPGADRAGDGTTDSQQSTMGGVTDAGSFLVGGTTSDSEVI
jgi:hypothetical protein